MANITNAKSTLGFQFTFSTTQKSWDVDFVLNIYRRHESILYGSKNSSEAVNIAYFASKPILSSNTMHISDRSSLLVANRVQKLDRAVSIESLDEYSVPTDKFIVTDIYTAEDNSNQSDPIFYKHILSTFNLPRVSTEDLTIVSDHKLTSVEILDLNFNALKLDAVKINWDTGEIYNNLVSSFDQDTGVAQAFYARFSVKNNVGLLTSYVELINNQTIFTQATFSDLDENLDIADPENKVYLIKEEEESLTVKLPTVSNYSFELLEDTRIHLVYPPESDIDDVWNVLITNGKFFSTINGISYKYSVGEFLDQAWNPGPPYKQALDEDAEVVSENLLKIRRSNVFLDFNDDLTFSGQVDVLVYDDDLNPLAAYTTESGKAGTISGNSQPFEAWTRESRIGIRSIDRKTGLIDIEGFKLKSNYKLTATYRYEEKDYEFTSVDFNPLNNPELLTKFVSVFLDPDSNGSIKDKTLYYTVSDVSGKIVQCNLPEFDNDSQLIQTSDGQWRQAYFETLPSYITDAVGSILFLSEYTVVGSGYFLPLGDVFVSEDSHPEQATIIDTRIRGGGIKESALEESKTLQSEVNWYWDQGFWDGTPYPGTASYYVEVPVEVLEAGGGTMSTAQVREVIDRHTAAGVYAIAKTYGIDPVISGVVPGDGYISVGWRSYEE